MVAWGFTIANPVFIMGNKEHISQHVMATISHLNGDPLGTLHDDLNLEDDLGIDGFDFIELIVALENIIHIDIPDAEGLWNRMTIGELINHIDSLK